MLRIVRNIRLIDGNGVDPHHDNAVLIDGERILKVGKQTELEAAPEYSAAEQIDGGGMTLLPGLINAHEHLTWRRGVGSWETRVVAKDAGWFIARGAGQSLISLAEGVTTVRDAGAKAGTTIALRDAIDEGLLIGPRMKVCGQTIAMTGGHAYETSYVADGPDAVRKAARNLLLQGADYIKLMASGGSVAKTRDFPWSPQFTVEEMRAAFEEAHHADKLTTVHCHPPQQIRRAVEAGVDCIEHAALIDPETAEFLANKNVPIVPTLAAEESFLVHGEAFGRDPDMIAAVAAKREETMARWRTILETGVNLIAGVDSLGDLNLELKLLVEIGMSPLDAIKAATSEAAKTIGMGDAVGTVEAGKYADLFLVEADPLDNIDNLRKIAWVMKGGELYTPAELQRAMGQNLSAPH